VSLPEGESDLEVRTPAEVLARLRDLFLKHRRRYIRKYMRPCANNCAYASVNAHGVTGCPRCNCYNPEQCRSEGMFVAIESKDEVASRFLTDIQDETILQHEYRDILTLLWMLRLPSKDWLGGDDAIEQLRNLGGTH
jgi:hypothetical protein